MPGNGYLVIDNITVIMYDGYINAKGEYLMTTDDFRFGTFDSTGKLRDRLTLNDARQKTQADRDEGISSDVVLLIAPHGFIDDTFKDDAVMMHNDLVEANARIARVQAIIDLHDKEFGSVHDEVYNTHPICGYCGQSYPCDTRTTLEDAIRR